jgi:ubiquinone/menaquinone biosynthesis methyltransferase
MSTRLPATGGTLVADKSQTPRMFTSIARRYDFLNHALSFNVDRRWRRLLVNEADVHAGERVLDVATGTGDVAIEFARRARAGFIAGLDPSSGMLEVGRRKLSRDDAAGARVELIEGDALALPFPDGSFDVVTIAFGLRNLPDYARGVNEMARVLRPAGRLVVLEFLPPRGVARLCDRASAGGTRDLRLARGVPVPRHVDRLIYSRGGCAFVARRQWPGSGDDPAAHGRHRRPLSGDEAGHPLTPAAVSC